MSELRVGMMVRYVGSIACGNNGNLSKSKFTGMCGIITADCGVRTASNGYVLHSYDVDIDEDTYFNGADLIPINPDNEAWGSYEDMIKDLNKELVKS